MKNFYKGIINKLNNNENLYLNLIQKRHGKGAIKNSLKINLK